LDQFLPRPFARTCTSSTTCNQVIIQCSLPAVHTSPCDLTRIWESLTQAPKTQPAESNPTLHTQRTCAQTFKPDSRQGIRETLAETEPSASSFTFLSIHIPVAHTKLLHNSTWERNTSSSTRAHGPCFPIWRVAKELLPQLARRCGQLTRSHRVVLPVNEAYLKE
jgi:hypothetical protein